MKTLDIHPDLINAGDEVVVRYLDMVASGTQPKMAEMLALQQPPGIGITQAIFISDQNRHGRSILDRHNGDKRAVERLRKGLAAKGYKLKDDDHYISTAANGFADPNAIVNQHQSFSDLEKRVARKQKEAKSTPPPKPVRLNPRIAERIRQQRIKENPDVARQPRREVIEDIVEKHGAPAS